VIRRYYIEGFLLVLKLSEKNSWVDLSLAGGYNSALQKKDSSYPSHINTSICVLKMLYWQNTDITTTGRDMMVCQIGFHLAIDGHICQKIYTIYSIKLKCAWNLFLTAFIQHLPWIVLAGHMTTQHVAMSPNTANSFIITSHHYHHNWQWTPPPPSHLLPTPTTPPTSSHGPKWPKTTFIARAWLG
jgi:hypothetical protein